MADKEVTLTNVGRALAALEEAIRERDKAQAALKAAELAIAAARAAAILAGATSSEISELKAWWEGNGTGR